MQHQSYSLLCKSMKELPPPLSRSQNPSSPQKLKLLCSFNGVFLPCPPSGKLRYIGGDTRIVSVNRAIGFSQLRNKISDFRPNYPSISLKYHILCHGGDMPLVPVETDDDVRRMIEEHDKLVANGKNVWLRVFACRGNIFLESNANPSPPPPFRDCSYIRNSNSNSNNVDLMRENSSGNKISMNHVSGTRTTPMAGGQVFPVIDDSGCGVSSGFSERTEISDCSYMQRGCRPITLTPYRTGIGSSVGSCRADVSGPNSITGYISDFRDLGSSCYLLESQFEPPLSRFSNGSVAAINGQSGRTVEVQKQVNDLKQGFTNFESLFIGDFNKESVMQIATSTAVTSSDHLGRDLFPLNNFIKNDGFLSNLDCDDSNNQIPTSSIRDNRTDSNDNRSLCSDPNGVGDHWDCGFEGKPCKGRCYAGPGSSCVHLGMPSYGDYEDLKEELGNVVSSARVIHHLFEHEGGKGILIEKDVNSCDVKSPGDGLLEEEFGNSNIETNNLDNFCLNQGLLEPQNTTHQVDCPSHSLNSVTTDQNPSFQAISLGLDLSCNSNLANYEIQSNHSCSNPFSESESAHHNTNPSYNWKLQENHTHSSAKASNVDCDLHAKSSVDLLQCNRSYSLPIEVVPPTQSSSFSSNDTAGSEESLPMHDHTSNNSNFFLDDASPRCEMWPYFKQLNLADKRECDYDSGVSDTYVQNEAKVGLALKLSGPSSLGAAVGSAGIEVNLNHYRENQKCTPSSIDVEGKVNVKESDCYSTVVRKIGNNFMAFYTQLLGTQELQTIRNSDLEEIHELGSGTYGTVCYGKWKGCDVAIKRIKLSCFAGDAVGENRLIEDFWKEARLLSQLRHPNVVAFYGVVTDGPPKNFATVTEYMVNGSLKQVLRRRDRTIDRRKRLLIAMDVAFGMEYLHEKNIVHFDLKSYNLLVNMRDPQRPVCKIGDLGLYKVKQKTLISGGVRGTIPWMAPELLTSKSGMVTEKVDIYSFGIVMWELLTGDEPYANMRSQEILAGIIKGNLRPEVPNWCDPVWRSLMERCWSSDPNSRPSFLEIGKELRVIAASMNIK